MCLTLMTVKAGSQYNASAAYRHLPSVTVDDGTKQNAVLALYCEPGLNFNFAYKQGLLKKLWISDHFAKLLKSKSMRTQSA